MSEFAHDFEMSREYQELDIARGLLSYLHQRVESAAGFQAIIEIGAEIADDPNDTGNVMLDSSHETEQVPSSHRRVVMGPRHRAPVIDKIKAVVVRAPVTADYDIDSTSSRPWNDLFLEVWRGRGRPQQHLLNSKGLARYQSASDIVPDLSYDVTGDLYAVDNDRRLPLKIPVAVLDHALRQYAFKRQSNDHRPPYHF